MSHTFGVRLLSGTGSPWPSAWTWPRSLIGSALFTSLQTLGTRLVTGLQHFCTSVELEPFEYPTANLTEDDRSLLLNSKMFWAVFLNRVVKIWSSSTSRKHRCARSLPKSLYFLPLPLFRNHLLKTLGKSA